MALDKVTEFYTKKFSVCPSITSKLQATAILERLHQRR
jgi:hypothetical protein